MLTFKSICVANHFCFALFPREDDEPRFNGVERLMNRLFASWIGACSYYWIVPLLPGPSCTLLQAVTLGFYFPFYFVLLPKLILDNIAEEPTPPNDGKHQI